ncbi:MAG: hypothetical protein ACM3ML_22085 [Micromonosporaceae bacterium]
MDDAQTGELARRLDALERRLARLERAERGVAAARPAAAENRDAELGPAFWVLNGLRARLAAGSGAAAI